MFSLAEIMSIQYFRNIVMVAEEVHATCVIGEQRNDAPLFEVVSNATQ